MLTTLFVHGLGQSPSSWATTINSLPKEWVITCPNVFDFCPSEDVTYEKLYTAFVDYCDRFPQPLNLCGISLGAILALNYAIDFPNKVQSLILIAAQIKMPSYLLKWQNAMFKVIPKKYFAKSGVEKSVLMQLTNSMLNLNFSRQLDCIKCPVLVICGAKDYVNQKASKQLANTLLDVQYCSIANAGHEVNIEQPQLLAVTIEDFYKDIHIQA